MSSDTLSMRFGIVQRSAGGDARKMAAYQMCARLTADGCKLDFTRKSSEHQGRLMLMPIGAPDWAHDPQTLWDQAEAAERRGDAQSARLMEFSIPRAVPTQDRLDFVRHVLSPFAAQGMGVQADLHSTAASDGGENTHAHAMFTLRAFDGDGFARTKAREWNTTFREGKGKAIREQIAARMNEWLADHGNSARIDHQSFADRGIEREPEKNVPRHAWKAHAANPDAPAAEPVRQVLAARAARADLAFAEAEERRASKAIAALMAQIAKQQEETTMPTAPGPRRRAMAGGKPTGTEPWMRFQGGLEALPERHAASARRSYARWIDGRPEVAARHDLANYVAYVQDRHAERQAEQPVDDQADEAQAVTTGADGIAPVSDNQAEARRRAHLECLLAGHYRAPAALAPYVHRVGIDRETRTATLHLRAGGQLIDHGDRVEHRGTLTPESAAAMAAAAAAHGWQRAHITGSADFRDAVAEAMALHEPPVPCDHTMSKAAQERVAQALRERAAAQVPALDGAALQRAAAASPAEAARLVLDHAEAQARAALAGRPTGSTDACVLAEPRIAEAIARRESALADAREAVQAAAAHREAHPWLARLLDGPARRRQSAMDAEAIRLDREARELDRGHERSVRRIERAATAEAKANRAATDDWQWSRPVRQAEVQLTRIESVRQAIAGGNPAAMAAAAGGDVLGAARSAEQRAQADRERAKRERRQREAAQRAAAGQAAEERMQAERERAENARAARAMARHTPKEPQAPVPSPRI